MTRTTKLVLTASALFLALYVGRPETATAGTASGSVLVTANVTATCTVTASPLAFGAYDPLVANLTVSKDVTAPLTYACTKSLPATISLDNVGTRAMVNGTSSLTYDIYTAADYSKVWGTTNTVAITGTGASATVNMYGRIPAGQLNLIAGLYSQTIQATINF
jgi:spore coat protein U-like protein